MKNTVGFGRRQRGTGRGRRDARVLLLFCLFSRKGERAWEEREHSETDRGRERLNEPTVAQLRSEGGQLKDAHPPHRQRCGARGEVPLRERVKELEGGGDSVCSGGGRAGQERGGEAADSDRDCTGGALAASRRGAGRAQRRLFAGSSLLSRSSSSILP